MTEPFKIAIVYGSARQGRFCDVVADWVFSRLWQKPLVEVSIVDPAVLWKHRPQDPGDELRALSRTMAEADGFIVVTPEYNHGYTAPLKHLIDSSSDEWRGKPVAFVSYGGISGGLRAVEQLRLVFAEMQATTIRGTVSFAYAWRLFGESGALKEPAEPNAAFDKLLSELLWWAAALKAGRQADQPREEAA